MLQRAGKYEPKERRPPATDRVTVDKIRVKPVNDVQEVLDLPDEPRDREQI